MEEASGTSSKEGEKSKLQKIYSRLSLWKNKPTSLNSTIRPSTSSKSSSPRTSLPPKKSSLSLKKRCSQNEEHPKFSAEQQSLHYITDDSLPSPNIPIMPSKSYESSSGRISPQKIYPRLPRSSQNDGLLTTSILKNCSVSLDKMSITPTQQSSQNDRPLTTFILKKNRVCHLRKGVHKVRNTLNLSILSQMIQSLL